MEFLSEFVSFLVQAAFWYFIISLVANFAKHKLEQKEEEVKEQLEHLNNFIHRVNVEQHGEVYYWFDADNDVFLGQGASLEEAVNHIRSRFPRHVFFVASKDQNYKLHGPEWKLQPINLKT